MTGLEEFYGGKLSVSFGNGTYQTISNKNNMNYQQHFPTFRSLQKKTFIELERMIFKFNLRKRTYPKQIAQQFLIHRQRIISFAKYLGTHLMINLAHCGINSIFPSASERGLT